MLRRPVVFALVGLLLALVAAPVILLSLAGSRAPASHVLPSGQSVEPSVDAVPQRIGPGDIGWVFAPSIFVDGPGNHYVLQAGTLADPAPVIDVEVPWVSDPMAQVGRMPAVGPAIGGTVTYVADDGRASSIHRLTMAADPEDEVLAEIPDIVWSMAVAPDGRHAYLALVDRGDDQRDLGVVRLALDGSGEVVEVMAPSKLASLERTHARLAAIARFGVDLIMSVDGQHLVRRTCAGGPCTIDVLDLDGGGVIDLGPREVMGAVGGVLLGSRCEAIRCFSEVIDLDTGQAQEIRAAEADATVALIGDRAAILFVTPAAGGGPTLRALDPFDGAVRDLLVMPQGSAIFLVNIQGDLRFSVPEGYVLASIATDVEGKGGAAVVPFHDVAIPLAGGQPIELPPPPLRHPDGLGIQG